MGLTWLNNGFICKELYAPFKIDKDIDYRKDLEKKYNILNFPTHANGVIV